MLIFIQQSGKRQDFKVLYSLEVKSGLAAQTFGFHQDQVK